MTVAAILTVLAVSAGLLHFLAGTIGLLRFPDVMSRVHALTKADGVGLGLIVLGLLPLSDGLLDGLKLLVVWVLVMVSGATVGQMIAAIGQPPSR